MARNPVVPGFAPDPSVCRVLDTYYLVTSTFEYYPGIALYCSNDLVRWEQIGSVLDRPDQLDLSTVPDSCGIFAPTIRHHDGTFYVVCTNVASQTQGASFVVTAHDPAGPWSDPVWIAEAPGIDPSLHFHDGKVWWTSNERAPEPLGEQGICEIHLREIDLQRGCLVGENRIIWRSALAGAQWTESPHLYSRGGWHYLLTAEGGTGLDHAVVVARSRDITGPYEGFAANPILTHRHLGLGAEFGAIGHADLVEHPDGTWSIVCLGIRRVDGHHILGRETFIGAVTWENDWPVVNAGVGRITAELPGPEPTPTTRSYDFTGAMALGPEWLGVRGLPPVESTPEGLLLLSASGIHDSEGLLGFAGIRLRDWDVDVAAVVRPDLALSGACGLMLRQSSRFHIRVEVRQAEPLPVAQLVCCADGIDEVILAIPLEPVVDELTLRLRVAGLEVTGFVERGGVTILRDSADGRLLSTERAGGFVGTVVGAFVEGGSTLLRSFSYEPHEGDPARR